MDTLGCRIPNTDPFNQEAMDKLKDYTKINCNENKPKVVQLQKDVQSKRYSLKINPDEAEKLNIKKPQCCMREVIRKNEGSIE